MNLYFQLRNNPEAMNTFSSTGMMNSSIQQLPSPQLHLKTEQCAMQASTRSGDILGLDVKPCPLGNGMNSPDWHGSTGFMVPNNQLPLPASSSSPTSHQHLPQSLPCNSAMSASSSLPPLCAGCRLRIVDKFYLCAVEAKWHTACLKCAECGVELENQASCFERDGQIYCKDDYVR